MAIVFATEQRAAHGAARRAVALLALLGAPLLAACNTSDAEPAPEDQEFPDIVGVAAESDDDDPGTWTFRVTVSSPYDTPERYADGWRVVGPDRTVYGVHTLLHDHANEQPFTRTQTGVVIPDDVAEVTIEGRDLANGYGGATVTITLDRN